MEEANLSSDLANFSDFYILNFSKIQSFEIIEDFKADKKQRYFTTSVARLLDCLGHKY